MSEVDLRVMSSDTIHSSTQDMHGF